MAILGTVQEARIRNARELAAVKQIAPNTVFGTVPPPKVPNAHRRPREYLTPQEVEDLMSAAKRLGRYGHRDAAMVLLAYRHGLRPSEVCALRWDQVELEQGRLHVTRLKHGSDSVHPLRGPELRALRRLLRDSPTTPYVFVSERGGPLQSPAFRKIVARAGEAVPLPFPVHSHMLRHACGFKLANDGHDTRSIQHYLGHRNIQHTTRYTELAADRFNQFWKD